MPDPAAPEKRTTTLLEVKKAFEDDNQDRWEPGDRIEVDAEYAKELIDGGYAKPYRPVTPWKPDTKIMTAAEAEAVAKGVADREIAGLKATRGDSNGKVAAVTKATLAGAPNAAADIWHNVGKCLQDVRDLARGHVSDRFKAYDDRYRDRTKAIQGASESVFSDGGALLPVEFIQDMLRIEFAPDTLPALCRTIPMTTARVEIPLIHETSRADGSRAGGVRAYSRAEGASITETKPGFGRVQLNLNSVMAVIPATNELLSDSPISLEALFSALVREEFGFYMSDKIINGTGVGQFLGILNSAARVAITKQGGQAAATIVPENIAKMYARLFSTSKARAVWLKNQDTGPQFDLMTLAVGLGGTSPPFGFPPYGRPMMEVEAAATLGTEGDVILADMSYYLIGRMTDAITATTSIHVYFSTEQTAFRFTMRADGRPWLTSPLTPFKGSATQAPFMTIETRS